VLVRATPKSSKDLLLGLTVRGDETRLLVKVRAVPQDGAANDAVARLIARSFGVAPSTVSIAAGAKDRDKTVLISGARLDDVAAWLSGLGRHGETH
jgi:uncharacterized protein (TIGR00251 family)